MNFTSPKVLSALVLAWFASLTGTWAQPTATLTMLHSFSALNGITNADGSDPNAALIQGSDGNFYGTTLYGFNGVGGIFKIAPDGTFTPLYGFDFDVEAPLPAPHGSHPTSSLVEGPDGNFYGTASQDGMHGGGTVFKITPDGTLTTLFDFGASDSNGNIPDGASPLAGLILGSDGNFYGTTADINAQMGTIYKITPGGALTTLHSFEAGEPFNPHCQLYQGSDGNFYGTGPSGGAHGDGGIFKLAPDGTFTTLYSFNLTDGAVPMAGLIQGADGSFYGTTTYGNGPTLEGTIFKITPAGVLTTLVVMNTVSSSNDQASSRLVAGTDGNFYGTTPFPGTIYQMTPTGGFTTLYTFPSNYPVGGLIQVGDGSFYGTTSDDDNFPNPPDGTIFRMTVAGVAGTSAPVINSAATATGVTGSPFSYQITASNIPTSYAATGLPAGLSINGATGLVSGTPTATGRFSVALGATNAGGTGTATLALAVAPAGSLVVSLVATTPSVTAGSGDMGEFTVSLSAPQANDVHVNLLIKGTGINGTDYVLLKTTKKIKAGMTSKPIKVIPLGDLDGAAKKTVVLELAPGGGYTIGTTGKVKVKIFAPTQ